ncbi:MAG: cysteine desulfurase [Methanomassiliicoccaceae archaeon]|nr:cysteine desulfurase [Methanomassiliicoccaceae archaeon]
MERCAYFDNGATTAVAKEVLDVMMPFFTADFGNPGSIHSMGTVATKAVSDARAKIATSVNCRPSEIIFTSGGTESDGLALTGAVIASGKKKIITSAVEHSAVLETCRSLKGRGYEVVILPVDGEGIVNIGELRKAIGDDTALVSVMAANNVIGTIQPIKEIAEIAKEHNALFHTDAVQAFTKKDIDVARDRVDLMSMSSHKIHGPKGVGALYVRSGVKLRPQVLGGGQEGGLRSSTENVPGIAGMGKAAELAMSSMKDDVKRMTKMRDRIIGEVLKIKGSYLNGPVKERSCSNAHFGFEGVKGNDLVLALSKMNIMVSTASACSAGSTEPSHVLTAIGRSPAEAFSSLRITLSRYTTDGEVGILLDSLPRALKAARK